jgi:hypothetical protein
MKQHSTSNNNNLPAPQKIGRAKTVTLFFRSPRPPLLLTPD